MWHLTGQTLVLLMAGTEQSKTLKFRGGAEGVEILNVDTKTRSIWK